MKFSAFLFLFAFSFAFVQSNEQSYFKFENHRNVTKQNFVTQILLSIGPDMIREFLLGNSSQSSIYRINLTNAFTGMAQTVKPHNSSQCIDDIFDTMYALFRLEFWALEMVDATSKIQSGLMDGNVFWPGSYVICKKVVQGPPYSPKYPEPYHGKFCWAEFEVATSWFPLPPEAKGFEVPPLKWALCVPHTCSSDEIFKFIHFVVDFEWITKLANLTNVSCLPDETDFWRDNYAIWAFTVFVTFTTIILCATIFDVYLKYSKIIHIQLIKNSTLKPDFVYAININTTVGVDRSGSEEQQQQTLPEDKEGLVTRIIEAFSVRRNFYKLFSNENSKSDVGCIHGIRVLSMVWIILSQSAVVGVFMADNLLSVFEVLQTIVFEIVINAILAIETLFFLSGLLVSYVYFTRREENNGRTSWIKFYFYRYLRLTPLYVLFVLVIDNRLIDYLTAGPFWPTNGFEGNNCDNNWWWNVLYINNFTPSKYGCLEHSWFLANNMQFYVLSPIVLILLTRYFRIGVIVSGVFIVVSWLTSGLISAHYGFEANINVIKMIPGSDDYYTALDNLFYKPYLHIAPYFIGILFGLLLHRTKFQQRLKIWMVCLGWTLSVAIFLFQVLGLHKANTYYNSLAAAFYYAFSRTSWSLMLCWIIFACSNGYGGIVNFALSLPIWQPFSRLTYCAYLVHILVIKWVFYQSNVPTHSSYIYMIYFAGLNSVVVYIISIPISLVFEMPILGLLKLRVRSKEDLIKY